FVDAPASRVIYILSLHDALPILALTLDRALITDASVMYIDHASGSRKQMQGMDLEMRWPTYAGEGTFEGVLRPAGQDVRVSGRRSEEHTSELQSREYLVCRLLLE